MSLTISLTPTDVEQRLGAMGIVCRFTPEERAPLDTNLVVDGPERLFAYPTPADNAFLTLENIKRCVGVDPKHQPAFFEHAWYKNEEFMRRRCNPGWHILTMDVLSGSIQQPMNYLSSSGVQGMELPDAVEVVLMLFLHYVGLGEQLLLKKHTWCSDGTSLNLQVTVGAFGRNGVFLSHHPSNFASQGLGICGKIVL